MSNLLKVLVVLLFIFHFGMDAAYGRPGKRNKKKDWTGEIPNKADNEKKWIELIDALISHQMHYGVMAAAQRVLVYFESIEAKEKAYLSIIKMIDSGYYFSTRHLFVSGDLSPSKGYDFKNSYNYYKGVINLNKGMQKWADAYFSSVDKLYFPKYIFYQAIEAYKKGELQKSKYLLFQLLDGDLIYQKKNLLAKSVRTLARIYFDEKKYDLSFRLYEDFLLRLNPIRPGDWLEAAWVKYHLEDYERAIGLLYNLESKTTPSRFDLEKYILRGLIYRKLCMVSATKSLAQSFKKKFGKVIVSIKNGEPLRKFEILSWISVNGNAEFFQNVVALHELQKEKTAIDQLDKGVRSLAAFLYKTEIAHLKGVQEIGAERAREQAATKLVLMSESLDFLGFEVSRQKFNPSHVFMSKVSDKELVRDIDAKSFLLKWIQTGDYWRDERLKMKGKVEDKCGLG